MKNFYTIILAISLAFTVNAQNPDLEWVRQMGGSGSDYGYSITTDAGGNVYTTGNFKGTVDFDPGAGIQNFTSAGDTDIFIQKLDANGGFLWAKQMGGSDSDSGRSITTDAGANIYTTGKFKGTADFDPGLGEKNLTSEGNNDIFIQKLDANGNFLWVKQIGGIGYDTGLSIITDISGHVYTTGSFSETADFNPGTGVQNLTSKGRGDIFIQKLDVNGNFLWAKRMGGSTYDIGRSIITDINNNVYTTGKFKEMVDFDPGTGIQNLTSEGKGDMFIQKLDANGNFLWAKQIGGIGTNQGASITTDTRGAIYITGNFTETVDFDPGPGVQDLTSSIVYDIFIQKLDADGNFLWAKQIGGSNSDSGISITTDARGNVYTTGEFSKTVDFDPGLGEKNLTSEGNTDIFIQKLDTNGNFLWVKRMGGSGYDIGRSIITDINNNVYTTGKFKEMVDFDPGTGIQNLTSEGGTDIFIQKIKQQ